MKFDHGDARSWIIVSFVAVAGFALYRYIPRHRLASGTITSGIIVLMVLKHVGLFSVFGAPSLALFRTLRDRMRRRAANR